MLIDDREALALTKRAAAVLREWNRPVVLTMQDINLAVGLIGAVQLALRHPEAAKSPTMQMVDGMIRALIDSIDPDHGDVFQFLMMGFHEHWDNLDERAPNANGAKA